MVAHPPSTPLPRLVVAAPATGSGKTTVATGLMAALVRAGHVVSGHKVGPDYIDPGYHALACGRPGRNLDPHLVGEHLVAPLLLNGARGADVAVIEGVMGLYDGRVGHDGFSSTAHVADLTASPVLLVVDISRASRSIGAVVHGMATFRGAPRIAGVVLNQAGSARHADEVASTIDLPVLGVLPRDESFATPSRHLGLVPAAERDEAAHALDRLAEVVAEHVDLDAVLDLARTAPALGCEPWDPAVALGRGSHVDPGLHDGPTTRPVVAVAGGRAFTFRYPETEELLRAAGCDVAAFDPMTDAALPPGTSGIYLGGGFPEVHAQDLSANVPLRQELRAAVAAGVPTVAECAGLLYLAATLDDAPMVGALPVTAAMHPRLTLRYPTATAPADSLLGRAGEEVTGHEFHRTRVEPTHGDVAAWTVDGEDVGFAGPALHASYLHTHWAGHPQLAARFATAVHAYATSSVGAPPPVAPPPAKPPLVEEPRSPSPLVEERQSPSPLVEEPRSPSPLVEEPRSPSPLVEERQSPSPLVGGRRRSSPLVEEGRSPVTRPPTAPTPATGPAGLPELTEPLRHHGDVEAVGMLDFAVNVHPGGPPAWLSEALERGLADAGHYPDPTRAEAAIAERHGRPATEVLATAGAAEAFGLLARLTPWSMPVVVHPQFTEPQAALEQAAYDVVEALSDAQFRLDPAAVPEEADLVLVGNPTNPTGVLHPRQAILDLLRPGRLVVVDEAFMDAVPGETESLAGHRHEGLVVLRSLTKHWGIPGVRAGYLLGHPAVVRDCRAGQTPWSVSSTATAAMLACTTPQAHDEAAARAATLTAWREHLEAGLDALGIRRVPSVAPFVLAEVGEGVHARLRAAGIAVRRGDTFPGLGPTWVRIAARPDDLTDLLLDNLPSNLKVDR